MGHASDPIKPQAAISPLPPTSSDEAEWEYERKVGRYLWDEERAEMESVHDPLDFDDFDEDETDDEGDECD
jgi:hypothetical protein